MRPRRGFAMLAALWLVVAIATVVLQFSLDARERRQLGLTAAEQGQGRALALGAVALTQARIEQRLREMPTGNTGGSLGSLRSSDPLLDADSTWGGEVFVDSVPATIRVRDLGALLNINETSEAQLRAFFSFALQDVMLADQLAQRIMDWRDADTLPRTNGAERDLYIKEGRLVLPTNLPFREVDELRHVLGMTPELFELSRPYLTTRGTGVPVNLNSAPEPVLRSIPGMTDQILSSILARRSNGRRIASVAEVLPRTGGGGRGGQNPQQQRLEQLATTTTQQLELTVTASAGPQTIPAVVSAVLSRGGSQMTVRSTQW